MIKIKKSVLAVFTAITATCLTSCGSKADVTLWGAFGSKYSTKLDSIVADMSSDLGMKIKHESKGSYPGIRKEMINAIATGKYPELAVGYPDHFAQYHGSGILRPLDDLVGDMINDYNTNYMPENYLYDQDGTKHLYGVPFNKSTELLGYNGVFVDYCADKYNDPDLKKLPETWGEWAAAKSDPTSKAGKYLTIYNELIDKKAVVFASQAEDGTATNFTVYDKDSSSIPESVTNKVKVFDFREVEKSFTKLMTWDSTDNAFITLVRQWDGKYTSLPSSEYSIHPKRRHGHILFANEENLPKTIEMLKFFRQMYQDGIFGTPSDIGGSFSSEAFARGCVMFMVCSSGGLSYNTSNWNNRFRVAPIPYRDVNHKYVISQGANICMTKKGNEQKALKVLKALTTGKFQTRWAIETGYFPASESAADSQEYKDFLKDTSYLDKDFVAYREGATVNNNEYRGKAHENEAGWIPWNPFVDDAFIGSAVVREQVAFIIPNVLKNVTNINDDAQYKSVISTILNSTEISDNINLIVE